MTTTVQPVGMDDLLWFIETAAVRMLQEELKRPELINMDQLYVLASMGMASGTAWVAKKDGRNIGALGAILTTNPYNPDIKSLAEMFWWVDPDYRDGRAGFLLMDAYDKKASEIADEATMCLLTTSPVNSASLAKRGWKLGEYAFRKEY